MIPALLALALSQPAPAIPIAKPHDVGMDPTRLAAIDRVVAEGIARKNMPGAVVLVGRKGRIVYRKAFGHRQVIPNKELMTPETLFDLASITKPVATATCVMKLVESGKLSLDDAVAKHWPDFAANGKEKITIRHLLTHTAGLIADNSLRDYSGGAAKAFAAIASLKPVAKPRQKFIYSDVGFLVLGKVTELVSGKRLDVFASEQIFRPLQMKKTMFNPPKELAATAAVTQSRNGRPMRGEVHDPRAYLLGGVGGHAGLFSTADDLARYAQAMIGGGKLGSVRILRAATVRQMTKAYRLPRGTRGLGWDKRSPYSVNRGDLMSESAFGHGGFTGTVLWIDPGHELFVVFLSNRVHPGGKGSVNRLAGRICTIAIAAVIPKVKHK